MRHQTQAKAFLADLVKLCTKHRLCVASNKIYLLFLDKNDRIADSVEVVNSLFLSDVTDLSDVKLRKTNSRRLCIEKGKFVEKDGGKKV